MASKPALPALFLVLPPVFQACTIALRPSLPLRLLAFSAFCFASCYAAVTYTKGQGDLFQDYIQGSAFGIGIANALHFLLIADPMVDFRRDGETVPPVKRSIWGRVYSAFGLQNSIRGVGWNYRLPHTPDSPKEEPRAFMVARLKGALWNFFLVDAAQSYIHWNPIFSQTGENAVSIASQGFIATCANVIAYCGSVCWALSMAHDLLGLVSVAVGFYQPKDFPPLFSPWRESYTVRRFWGRTWHQTFRWSLSAIGKTLAKALGAQPGSNLSSYTQLYTAFILSGLIHCLGDAMVRTDYFGASFLFFFIQAVAITVEDVVIAAARKTGSSASPSLAIRAFGYAWVWCWFAYSVPLMVDLQVAAGLAKSEMLPVSPIRFVLNA
ncbi:hypothetical protein HWV62_19347, partial [Athelia sp. TMB]